MPGYTDPIIGFFRGQLMKNTLKHIALIGALFALPLTASATMTDAEARAAVQDMLQHGSSSTDIIETLMEDGRSLKDATVLSVETATGDAKVDLARVGICLSEDVAKAQEVGGACVDVCTPDTAEIIESLIEGYVTGMCEPEEDPPSIYGTSGGGVSPAT
jgi:hypothetical protein